MNHILTERLRLSVPDIGNLEGHKFVFELMLKSAGRTVSDADRASVLTDYGLIKHCNLPCVITLRESGEMIGVVTMTMNLDAFAMVEERGKASFQRDKPLEIGVRLYVNHQQSGHGYGLEAARAFIDYMMNVLPARRVVSEARASVVHAVRLMERLGMAIHHNPSRDRPDRIIGVLQRQDVEAMMDT